MVLKPYLGAFLLMAASVGGAAGVDLLKSFGSGKAADDGLPAAAENQQGGGTAEERELSGSEQSRSNRVANITAASTYYDSKEGIVFFSGGVCVDDEQYQLHSDSAYVFMDKEGTNDLKRIIAVGNVAITNDTKRAYGAKVSYFRESGMMVLYAPKGGFCEVRDDKESPPQSVKGTKIKFWLGAEQVEVQGANITAPVSGEGAGGLKNAIGGKQ